tara:strand:+ start:482 stop:862 length:381 start_codon:yes stop_codon:yes gene_type:complete
MKLKHFIVPSIFDHKDVTCGWGNGYIVIPKGHPILDGKHDDLFEDLGYNLPYVHGGCTYTNLVLSDNHHNHWHKEHTEPGDFIIGFDTSHSGDSLEKWPGPISVLKETVLWKHKLEKFFERYINIK